MKFSHIENSKESLGSLSLVTRKPLLNGKIETIEKISHLNFNSNVNIENSSTPNRMKTTSKFGFQQQFNTINNEDGGEDSPSKGMIKKKIGYEDLHKKAIINNLSNFNQDDKKTHKF